MTPYDVLKQLLHHDLGFDHYSCENVPKKTFRIVAKGPGILSGTIYVPKIIAIAEKEFFGTTHNILTS